MLEYPVTLVHDAALCAKLPHVKVEARLPVEAVLHDDRLHGRAGIHLKLRQLEVGEAEEADRMLHKALEDFPGNEVVTVVLEGDMEQKGTDLEVFEVLLY